MSMYQYYCEYKTKGGQRCGETIFARDSLEAREIIKMRPDFDYLGFAKDYQLQMPVKDICTKYNISNSTYQRIKSSLSLHR